MAGISVSKNQGQGPYAQALGRGQGRAFSETGKHLAQGLFGTEALSPCRRRQVTRVDPGLYCGQRRNWTATDATRRRSGLACSGTTAATTATRTASSGWTARDVPAAEGQRAHRHLYGLLRLAVAGQVEPGPAVGCIPCPSAGPFQTRRMTMRRVSGGPSERVAAVRDRGPSSDRGTQGERVPANLRGASRSTR